MELAVHMKNRKTGKKRIWKTNGENASHWVCKDFFYKSEWEWTGTEPWENVADSVVRVGRGYYRKREQGT